MSGVVVEMAAASTGRPPHLPVDVRLAVLPVAIANVIDAVPIIEIMTIVVIAIAEVVGAAAVVDAAAGPDRVAVAIIAAVEEKEGENEGENEEEAAAVVARAVVEVDPMIAIAVEAAGEAGVVIVRDHEVGVEVRVVAVESVV
jgi:hypothetical protein